MLRAGPGVRRNARLYRCLIHHVRAERRFTPPGMVFPSSPVMLDQIDTYRDTLRLSLRSSLQIKYLILIVQG